MLINHEHAAIHAPDRIDAKLRESVVAGSMLVQNGGAVQSIASVLRSPFHSRRDDHSMLTCSPTTVLRGSPPPPCSILAPCSVCDAGAALDAGATLHSASNASSDVCDVRLLAVRLEELPDG